MIRIDITQNELLTEIRARSSQWLDSAKKTRELNKSARKYEVSKPNWSDIKGAYIKIQKGRCAYCERELTIDEREGGHEWDVEHFRPKSSVRAWPTPKIREERGINYDLPNSTSSTAGYYLLSHHPLNYVVSCKICNSKLKGSYFPVNNAPRQIHEDDPSKMSDEGALLVYPLGDLDDDPEDLIGIPGFVPQVTASTDDKKLRARVTIDFFDLAGRPTLIRQRATAITHLANNLEFRDLPGMPQRVVRRAERVIDALLKGLHPHTNCARSFKRLYDTDKAEAERIAERARIIFERDPGSNP